MDVREKLEVIAHLGDHISYKEDIGICYDSTLAKVIEYAYMELKNGVTVKEWIPVTERLPESGVHVLVACEMRGQYLIGQYVCDGYYAKAKTQPSYGNPDECAVEYSEEDDEYYLLEGWYEVIKNWDDYNSIVIDDFVTHWMPLPQPPKGE